MKKIPLERKKRKRKEKRNDCLLNGCSNKNYNINT